MTGIHLICKKSASIGYHRVRLVHVGGVHEDATRKLLPWNLGYTLQLDSNFLYYLQVNVQVTVCYLVNIPEHFTDRS